MTLTLIVTYNPNPNHDHIHVNQVDQSYWQVRGMSPSDHVAAGDCS